MFVATIVGNPPMNFIPCAVEAHGGRVTLRHPVFSLSGGGEALVKALGGAPARPSIRLGVRPEDITFEREGAEHTIPAEIFVVEPLGNEKVIDVKMGEEIIKVLADPDFPGFSRRQGPPRDESWKTAFLRQGNGDLPAPWFGNRRFFHRLTLGWELRSPD